MVGALLMDVMETLGAPIQQRLIDRIVMGNYGLEQLDQLHTARSSCGQFALNLALLLSTAGGGGEAASGEGGGEGDGSSRAQGVKILAAAMSLMERYQKDYAQKEALLLERAADRCRAALAAATSVHDISRLMHQVFSP